MQPARGRSRDLRQPSLDVEVDVLEFAFEDETALLDVAANLVEAPDNGVGVRLTYDALRRQHQGMRLRSRDIVIGEAFVEVDGGVDFLHNGGGAAREAAPPHLVRGHRPNRCPICASRS